MTVPPGTPAITLEAGPGLGFADIVIQVRDAALALDPAFGLLAALLGLATVAATVVFATRRPRPEMITRQRAEAAAERGETR